MVLSLDSLPFFSAIKNENSLFFLAFDLIKKKKSKNDRENYSDGKNSKS